MTKRFYAWMAIALVALASLVVGMFGLTGTRTVRLSEAMIQERINAQLPKVHNGVTLTNATLDLLEHDISMTLAVEGNVLGQQFALTAKGAGIPEYRRSEQAFYFRPSELGISELTLRGESAADRIGKFTDRYVTNPGLRENIETSLPGLRLWLEDNLEPRALALLGQVPLYKPKNDMKGIIIKATLANIAIDNGALVLSFSIWELTKTVFFCVFLLVFTLGGAAVMLRHPAWGIPLLILS